MRQLYKTQIPGLDLDHEGWDYLRRLLELPPAEAPTTVQVAMKQTVPPKRILDSIQRPQCALEVYTLADATAELQFWRQLRAEMDRWFQLPRDGAEFIALWQGLAVDFTHLKLPPRPPGRLKIGSASMSFDIARWNNRSLPLPTALTLRRQIGEFCVSHGLRDTELSDFWPGVNERTLLRELSTVADLTCELSGAVDSVTVTGAGSLEVNGTYHATGERKCGWAMYRHASCNGFFMFRYTMAAWQNVYWYISWLADLEVLVENPSIVRERYRDYYRTCSNSQGPPPADGWDLVRERSRDPVGQLPAPEVVFIEGSQLEIASMFLANAPEWSGSLDEAGCFIQKRLPLVMSQGLDDSSSDIHDSDSEESEEPYDPWQEPTGTPPWPHAGAVGPWDDEGLSIFDSDDAMEDDDWDDENENEDDDVE